MSSANRKILGSGHATTPEGPVTPEAPVPAPVVPELTETALHSLQVSVIEAMGLEQAEEVLFRIGRSLGQDEARKMKLPGESTRARLVHGLGRLRTLGLGSVTLEEFHYDLPKGELRLRGHLLDTLEVQRQEQGRESQAGVCGLTAGYLTGLAAETTGLDVVCSPFHCSRECGPCGCLFEITPAHQPTDHKEAPAGSARFFLGSMGGTMGERDISLSDLVENAGDAIALIDSENVVRFWSQGAERIFQYGREEIVGREAIILVPDDLRQEDELGWIRAKLERDGKLDNFTTRRIRKDGKELAVSLSRSVLHDSQGRIIGSTAIIRDITESVRTQDELLRARSLAMVGELASQIAHEIKNPLAGIYGATQILARGMEAEDPRREVLQDVSTEILRLDETVQDLLRFARPVPPKPTPTALHAFVRDTIDWIDMQPDAEAFTFEIDIDENLIVDVDQKLIGQVVSNLIHNAMQAMTGGGVISVAARRTPGQVLLDVRDTGPGIPEDIRASIFEPFFTTKSRGSGLGLAIAKKNLEAHGGSLEMETTEGRGSVFRIVFKQ